MTGSACDRTHDSPLRTARRSIDDEYLIPNKMAMVASSLVFAARPKAQRVGRATRLTVHNNVKLVHVKQNTQQKIASMQVGGGGQCARMRVRLPRLSTKGPLCDPSCDFDCELTRRRLGPWHLSVSVGLPGVPAGRYRVRQAVDRGEWSGGLTHATPWSPGARNHLCILAEGTWETLRRWARALLRAPRWMC